MDDPKLILSSFPMTCISRTRTHFKRSVTKKKKKKKRNKKNKLRIPMTIKVIIIIRRKRS